MLQFRYHQIFPKVAEDLEKLRDSIPKRILKDPKILKTVFFLDEFRITEEKHFDVIKKAALSTGDIVLISNNERVLKELTLQAFF